MLNGLDLFSGIGGLSIALSEWVRPIAYCEIDPYCQGVLLSRMGLNQLAEAPIWDNILTFSGTDLRGAVDIVYGGFPCQDISYAGKGAGLAGERSGLWYEYARIVRELAPRFVVVENVSALLTRGLDAVLGTLASLGADPLSVASAARSTSARYSSSFVISRKPLPCTFRISTRGSGARYLRSLAMYTSMLRPLK